MICSHCIHDDKFLLLSVPKKCVYELWEAFNDIAEGFGLTIEEFQEIVKSALMEYLSITERMLNSDTDAVFRLFDDDEVFVDRMPCDCLISFCWVLTLE